MDNNITKLKNVRTLSKHAGRRSIFSNRIILIFIALAIITVGVFGFSRFMPGGSGSSNPDTGVFTVKRGDLIISVTEGGDIKAEFRAVFLIDARRSAGEYDAVRGQGSDPR